MTQTNNLRDMKKSEMRAFARRIGLRWYTGLNKVDLANFIEDSISKRQAVSNESWRDYSKLKVSEMRTVARENGLRGWTNLKKVELGKFLSDKLNSQPTTDETVSNYEYPTVKELEELQSQMKYHTDRLSKAIDMLTIGSDKYHKPTEDFIEALREVISELSVVDVPGGECLC